MGVLKHLSIATVIELVSTDRDALLGSVEEVLLLRNDRSLIVCHGVPSCRTVILLILVQLLVKNESFLQLCNEHVLAIKNLSKLLVLKNQKLFLVLESIL